MVRRLPILSYRAVASIQPSGILSKMSSTASARSLVNVSCASAANSSQNRRADSRGGNGSSGPATSVDGSDAGRSGGAGSTRAKLIRPQ